MKHVLACAALLAAASPPAVVAAPPVNFFGELKVPLLYQISHISFGDASNDRQAYVFRDGTVLLIGQGSNDELQSPPLGGVSSGQAPAIQMKGLLDDLIAARVGIQEDCTLESQDPSADGHHIRFTWFGKGRRQNTFDITDGPGTPCPQEIINLRNTLQHVLNGTAVTTHFSQ